MNIGLYQDYSKIFLGLTLEEFQTCFASESSINPSEIENKLAESLYYHLDKNDIDLNRKFHSNLTLCNKKSDKSYKDWLIELAKEIKPDFTPDKDLESLVLKPRPKTVKKEINTSKPKPIIIPKTKTKPKVISKDIIKKGKGKQNNVFERPVEVYVIPSEALCRFMTGLNLETSDSNSNLFPSLNKPISIALIKETVNKYICDKNLQDLVQRSVIHLDSVLQTLFEDQRKGKKDITYLELRDYIRGTVGSP